MYGLVDFNDGQAFPSTGNPSFPVRPDVRDLLTTHATTRSVIGQADPCKVATATSRAGRRTQMLPPHPAGVVFDA